MEEDDWQPKPKSQIIIGEDLSTLSVKDLEARLNALEAEKERVMREIKAKHDQADLAASLFKNEPGETNN